MARLRMIILLALAGFALAACGRADPPELPPSVTAPPTEEEDMEKAPERPFILDGLLN
jgi:predicted small lipoprotein YifL